METIIVTASDVPAGAPVFTPTFVVVLLIVAVLVWAKRRYFKGLSMYATLSALFGVGTEQEGLLQSTEAFYGPDPLQRVVIYRAVNPKGLVIQVHGGGWNGGDLTDNAAQAQALCDDGWTVLNINHRLAPTAQYPLPVDDVAAVVEAAKNGGGTGCTNPQLWTVASRAARKKVVLVGNSAGGHIAHLAALRPGLAVDRVVSISAPLDLRDVDLYAFPGLVDALITNFAGATDRSEISPGVIPVTGVRPERIAYLANEDTVVPPATYFDLQPDFQVTFVTGLEDPQTPPTHAITEAQSIALAIQGVNAVL